MHNSKKSYIFTPSNKRAAQLKKLCKNDMITINTSLSKELATEIINWYNQNGNTNWGDWSNYPKLPVGAKYLQYDDNPCVIKLDQPLSIAGTEFLGFKYIATNWRCPGAKNAEDVITFDVLEAWCMPEAVAARYDQRTQKMKVLRDEAVAKFNTLPESLRNNLIALTIEHCGSGRKRKAAIAEMIHGNSDVIAPVISARHARQVLDYIHFKDEDFS